MTTFLKPAFFFSDVAGNIDQIFKCDICGSQFGTRPKLIKHQVALTSKFVLSFTYGSVLPWIRDNITIQCHYNIETQKKVLRHFIESFFVVFVETKNVLIVLIFKLSSVIKKLLPNWEKTVTSNTSISNVENGDYKNLVTKEF